MAGLSDILTALGEELRSANRQVGEYSVGVGEDGIESKQPILFLSGASVELEVAFTVGGSGGVDIWVVKADGSTSYERSGKITVQLNTEGSLPVGM